VIGLYPERRVVMKPGTAVARTNTGTFVKTEPVEFWNNRFNRLLETLGFLPFFAPETSISAWTPAAEIFETEKALVVRVELTGVRKEDVSVSVEDNVLTIRGERRFEEETKRENYHRTERNYGEFYRTFTFPNYIDPTRVDAEFKEGLLEINLPKREEAKAKQVQIR
jgi:HSP20 family protein